LSLADAPVSFFLPVFRAAVGGAVAGSGKSAASSSRNACVSSILDLGFLPWLGAAMVDEQSEEKEEMRRLITAMMMTRMARFASDARGHRMV
jgi:hypothetical protein